jgi:DNA-directed RNA polymerase subunit E'/Rpb7
MLQTNDKNESGPVKGEIYSKALLTSKIQMPFSFIGRNVKDVLEEILAKRIEGKCSADGFVKPGSTRIITYSSGVVSSKFAVFEVVYECMVCTLVEGMIIECIVKNVSTAGIRALTNEEYSPVCVYVARDHHYDRSDFAKIKEEETIYVRVIGQRFELNDQWISVIGELSYTSSDRFKENAKKKNSVAAK